MIGEVGKILFSLVGEKGIAIFGSYCSFASVPNANLPLLFAI